MGEHKNKTHKALYRKYRSKSLHEIVGQEHITKTLANAIEKGKLSHAYLFTGPRGVGKTSIARIVAHEINQLPYGDEQPHLDIIEIDAASNRRIDDIRELREKVHIAPVAAKYKVYIIDEVHMLTTESFNALLKTLEEPPAHVIFIMATTEVHKLPATIISRAQRHSFRSVPKDQVAAHLKHIAEQEKIAITDEALELLAEHGEGSFRDSISLLDQLSSSGEKVTVELIELLLGLAPQKILEELLETTAAGDGKAVLQSLQSLLESGLAPSAVALQLLQLIRKNVLAGKQVPWQLKLMDELLLVNSAAYPRLKLETVLLDAMPSGSITGEKVTTTALVVEQPQKSIKPAVMRKELKELSDTKPTEEKPALATTKTEEPIDTLQETTPFDASNIDIQAVWPGILTAIQERNKPLATIVRQAVPHIDTSGLTLVFGMSFHQKRVDDMKHRVIVAQAAESVLGSPITVQATHDASAPKPTLEPIEPSPNPAHASLVQGIQDIMGGGDIVNA